MPLKMPSFLKVDLFTYSFSCLPQYLALSMHVENIGFLCLKPLSYLGSNNADWKSHLGLR